MIILFIVGFVVLVWVVDWLASGPD
jgi:hypothetical protein